MRNDPRPEPDAEGGSEPVILIAAALIALALGLAFIAGGVLELALAGAWRGAALMAVGCYGAAASLLALSRGRAARAAFAPAAALTFGSVLALGAAAGA